MGNSLISLRALRKRRAWEGARRTSRRWLTGMGICLVGLGFACSREPQAVLVEALASDQAVGDPEQEVVPGLVGREQRHRIGEPDGRVLVAPDLHRRSVPVR